LNKGLATVQRFALFDYGFRPLFLACGLFGMLAIPAWLWIHLAGEAIWAPLPSMLWHAHEMIFGFMVAAIAGFLLTAIPSWTGARGFAGRPLVTLTLIWLSGRAALLLGPGDYWWLALVAELAFLPALAFLLAPPILRERNRNLAMLGVLAALWVADAAFLYAITAVDIELANRSLRVALDIVLLLITIIGGRIVPAFTGNALRGASVPVSLHSWPWLERSLIGLMLLNVVASAFYPEASLSGVVAALAAMLHAVRLAGWRSLRIRGNPILWVLHVAYAWLPLAFALKAVALLTGASFAQFWLHAFGIGAVATMILAVMSRVSLGHTGRALVVARPIAGAYVMLTLSALSRVLLPHTGTIGYDWAIVIAGLLWTAAFALFVAVYGPILARPRVDGRPG